MSGAAIALAAGLLGVAAWIALAAVHADAAFQGWIVGFVFWSGPALGALALALIRRLTGGRWGEAFAPELEPAARTAPLLLLFAVPVALGLPSVYGWAAAPAAVDASVRAGWLNAPLWIARDLVLLLGWSALALGLSASEAAGERGRVWAGAGLAFHGVATSLVAVDWIGSVVPSFVNSAAGMTLVAAQLAAALAWIGLQGEHRPARAPAGDVAGLLFATLLGLIYLVFMAFLVQWYGDRPEPNRWWLPRARAPWGLVVGAAALVGGLGPAVALLARRLIGMRRALRTAGALALAGLALYTLWLFAPSYGAGVLPAALLAMVAQGGLWIAAEQTVRGRLPAERLSHGLIRAIRRSRPASPPARCCSPWSARWRCCSSASPG